MKEKIHDIELLITEAMSLMMNSKNISILAGN